MFLFYTPDIDTSCVLGEQESQHAVRVLRLGEGDHIMLTDGRGTTYEAAITLAHPRHCEFMVLSSERQERRCPYSIHIAIAPTKNMDRLEWMVEKCTEIGVDEITPLLCRYSERRQLKTERLEKVMASAAMQSLKAHMPKLNNLTTFDALIASATEEQRFIAHCYKDERHPLAEQVRAGSSVLVLIGPEGDFSEDEVSRAIRAGFVPVSLGNSRLRTETAGIVACHTVTLKNELAAPSGGTNA